MLKDGVKKKKINLKTFPKRKIRIKIMRINYDMIKIVG
jgi:hypothetical protein